MLECLYLFFQLLPVTLEGFIPSLHKSQDQQRCIQAVMAVAVPKLPNGSEVRIRISSLDLGTTRWKEGVFEIHEKDNKVNLLLKFNSGGAAKNFQVSF